jgi:hypothetical protein
VQACAVLAIFEETLRPAIYRGDLGGWPWLATVANAQTLVCAEKSGGAKLVDASAFFDKTSEIQGERKELKNGYDEILPLNVEYLVCAYEDDKKEWKYFKPRANVNSCALQVRHAKKTKRESIFNLPVA